MNGAKREEASRGGEVREGARGGEGRVEEVNRLRRHCLEKRKWKLEAREGVFLAAEVLAKERRTDITKRTGGFSGRTRSM